MALPTPRDAYRELIDGGVDSAAKGAYPGAMGLPLTYAQTYKQVYTAFYGSFPSEQESMMQEYNEKAQRLSNTEGIGIRKDAEQSGDVAFATSDISTCPIPGLAFTSKKKGVQYQVQVLKHQVMILLYNLLQWLHVMIMQV